MLNRNDIREHADIIGADGAHIGMVDRVEGDRIKLTKADSGASGFQSCTLLSRSMAEVSSARKLSRKVDWKVTSASSGTTSRMISRRTSFRTLEPR